MHLVLPYPSGLPSVADGRQRMYNSGMKMNDNDNEKLSFIH